MECRKDMQHAYVGEGEVSGHLVTSYEHNIPLFSDACDRYVTGM